MENYEVLTGDAEVKRLAEIRLMSKLEEKSALLTEREAGREEGREEGKEQGWEQAELMLLKKYMKKHRVNYDEAFDALDIAEERYGVYLEKIEQKE